MKHVPGTLHTRKLMASWLNIWKAVIDQDMRSVNKYVDLHASMFVDKERMRGNTMQVIEHAKHDRCLPIEQRIERITHALSISQGIAA